jgi:hypothetical protein
MFAEQTLPKMPTCLFGPSRKIAESGHETPNAKESNEMRDGRNGSTTPRRYAPTTYFTRLFRKAWRQRLVRADVLTTAW